MRGVVAALAALSAAWVFASADAGAAPSAADLHAPDATQVLSHTSGLAVAGQASMVREADDADLVTTTVITSASDVVYSGEPVTLTIDVTTPGGEIPTGTVSIAQSCERSCGSGFQSLGQLVLVNGRATLQTAALEASDQTRTNYTFRATYQGDTGFAASQSEDFIQPVAQNATVVTLTSDINPSQLGEAVTFTATVTSLTGPGTINTLGTNMSFRRGFERLAEVRVVNNQASFTTDQLAPGEHILEAWFRRTDDYQASISEPYVQTVEEPSDSDLVTTTVITSASDVVYSGEPVTLTIDVTTPGGEIPTGTVSIAQSCERSCGSGFQSLGQLVLVNGRATLQTAALEASDQTRTNYTFRATYQADTGFAASQSEDFIQPVAQNATVVTLTSDINPSQLGEAVTFTATVTSLTGPGTINTLGTNMSFRRGFERLAEVRVVNNQASFTTDQLAPGEHILEAWFRRTDDYQASISEPYVQTVEEPSDSDLVTTTVITSASDVVYSGEPVTLTIDVTTPGGEIPTGTVSIAQSCERSCGSGFQSLGQLVLVNGRATLQTAALEASDQTRTNYTFRATYQGDTGFAASQSEDFIQPVAQNATVVTLTSDINPSQLGEAVTFTATVTSLTGPGTINTLGTNMSFRRGFERLAEVRVVNNQASFTTDQLAPGEHILEAWFRRTDDYQASISEPYFHIVGEDTSPPEGYIVTFDDLAYSIGEANPVSFTLSGGEVGARFDYTITSSGGGTPVTGSGIVVNRFTQVIGGIDASGLGDGRMTVSATLTDVNGNVGEAATHTVLIDQTAPGVSITSEAESPVSGPFRIDITFTERVVGLLYGSDITVSGGTTIGATPIGGSKGRAFFATITPTGDGTITVDIPAGVAEDRVRNLNTAAEQFTIVSDSTAPTLQITSDQSVVNGPFEATFTFNEAVTGFEASDIAVTNGSASSFSGTGAVYTATITPDTVGDVSIVVGAGAGVDAANNDSAAGNLTVSVEAIASTSIALELGSNISNPGDVTGRALIRNPGSQPLPFTATPDVNWLDVDPSSGTIPSLGELALNVALNANVDDLEPGDYSGTIIVEVGSGTASAPAGIQASPQSTSGQILAQIPVSLTVRQRFGSIELVATTPSGISGEASFSYASDLEAFDGLSLTTLAGRASVSLSEQVFGSYLITQSAPPGWRLESISCLGDVDGGSTFDLSTGQAVIDLDPGEALVCTFANIRDEDAVRLATQRAIRNFMARRADRIVAAAPDLSSRFAQRDTTQRGSFSADIDGSGRSQMAFSMSLAGLRNAAAAETPEIAGVTRYERPVLEDWDIWLATEWSRVEDNRGGDDVSSDFMVAQLGVDYAVTQTLILGLMAQYDWMDEASSAVNVTAGAVAGARVEGEGWMAGPYAVWRLHDQLTLDAMSLYGISDNTVNPLGLYQDDFETDRVLIRANLTGEFEAGDFRIRPRASLTYFEDRQASYVDSLNITIPEQTVDLGRLTAGPEVAWRYQSTHGGFVELSTNLQAVWDYNPTDQLSEAGLLVSGNDRLRADARIGLRAGLASGMALRLDAGFAGIGMGDFEATTARLEVRIPFGGAVERPGSGRGAALGSSNQLGCDDHSTRAFTYAAGLGHTCDRSGPVP